MARPRNPSLEVVASYRGMVLDVQHLRPRASASAVVGMLRSMLGGPQRWRYTVGEGDAASFAAPPVDLVTPEAFELARVGARGTAWVRFTADMVGEIVVAGRRFSLRQWVQRGWAVAEGGVFGTTLPPGARARIRHGEVTFHLAPVESPEVRLRHAELDAPFWGITAAAFVVLGGLLMLAQLAMPGTENLELEEHARRNRFVAYVHQPAQARERRRQPEPQPQPLADRVSTEAKPPPVPKPVVEPPLQAEPSPQVTAGAPRGGGRMPRSRGGVPSALGEDAVRAAADLMMRGSGPIERARTAGILAFVDMDAVVNNPYANAWNPDTDDRDMWEATKNQDFMAHAVAGRNLIGKGRGGGPGSADDLATSKPRIEPDAEEDEDTQRLVVRVGRASVRGPRARDAVRAAVARHARVLRGCYDQGLKRDPKLSGQVTLTLELEASGEVAEAEASGLADSAVCDCIVAAAKGWRFAETDRSRPSHVSVPLTLETN